MNLSVYLECAFLNERQPLSRSKIPLTKYPDYRDYELLHSPLATIISLWDYNKIKCIAGLRPELIWII
jgi:hypothetical protein